MEEMRKKTDGKLNTFLIYFSNGYNELSDSFFSVEYLKNGRSCWNAQTLKLKKNLHFQNVGSYILIDR
jgi:hypothetical protein